MQRYLRQRPPQKYRRGRLALAGIGAGLAVFALANGIVYALYHNRTYPHTTVAGYPIGSTSQGNVPAKLQSMVRLPAQIRVLAGSQSRQLSGSDIPASINYDATAASMRQGRGWLPLVSLLSAHSYPLLLDIDQQKLQTVLTPLIASSQLPPTDAHITLNDGQFSIKPEAAGQQFSLQTASRQLVAGLQNRQSTIRLSSQKTNAKVTAASLQPDLAKLQTQLKTGITLHYEQQTKKFTAAELASWYAPSGTTYTLSDENIKSALSTAGASFGISVKDLDKTAATAHQAIIATKDTTIAIEAVPASKTFTYCTAVRGVDSSNLSILNSYLLSTYADPRGWGMGGQVAFKHVEGGCDLTVWLAAADQMPSFGAICDSQWSCTVSPNVIINYDRWQNGTDTWNAARPNDLGNYRAMAINHETGHWLGFNHSNCPVAGQPAPVMEQQSINLQGCVFNPWPLPSEQAVLKSRLGI
jgi:hypothetical protein